MLAILSSRGDVFNKAAMQVNILKVDSITPNSSDLMK